MIFSERTIISWLDAYRSSGYLKLITGIRGCGKSHLLGTYRSKLAEEGVDPARIVSVELDCNRAGSVKTAQELIDFVESNTAGGGRYHVMIDEITELSDYDVAVGVLFADKNLDIILTSSNKTPVTKYLNEYLSGQYVAKEMFPPRVVDVKDVAANYDRFFGRMLEFGMMPFAVSYNSHCDVVGQYLSGLLCRIYVKDILVNTCSFDSFLANAVLRSIYQNTGKRLSLRRILKDMNFAKGVSINTIDAYLGMFEKAFLLRRVSKFDMSSRKVSQSGYQFFFSDLGLYSRNFGECADRPALMRTIIYLELLKYFDEVYVGSYDRMCFDFVTFRDGRYRCWHYIPSVSDPRDVFRAVPAFKHIPEDVRKTVVTDAGTAASLRNGVELAPMKDFLISPDGSGFSTRGQ